jgi:hypothetical protein
VAYTNNVTDTIFADVSEFQVPVTNAYTDAGYRVLSIRSNDGTYRDHNFGKNQPWCIDAVNQGRMDFFIVYAYWRPNWQATLDTMKSMIGTPHPKLVAMIDLESGGNPGGDHSDGVNKTYWGLADWLGNPARVIGYANAGDFNSMWRTRPPGLRVIGAGYGRNPNLAGQIAHQYTDGRGFGGGLPEGAPPFGNCDMNSADGLSSQAFASACGVGTGSNVGLPPVGPGPTQYPKPLPTDNSIFGASEAIISQFIGTRR